MTQTQLRKGWTTGACAAAAAKAAVSALDGNGFPDPVTIRLPRGETPSFPISTAILADGRATAGVLKDAGDDPDITHGAEIRVTAEAAPPGSGLAFHAGDGVGTVTLPGLPLAVGEAAINPGPRKQIADNLEGRSDLILTVSIPGGEALATKTLNGRLGIKGGLSILGTTGVVIPYSCSAWLHSVHRGIDVAHALGLKQVAAVTGKTSEAVARRQLPDLPEAGLIDMGDMAGGLLKYLRRHPLPRLLLVGGFGKLTKLAAGHLDLHSRASRVESAFLAALLAELGFPGTLPEGITAAQALELAAPRPLGDLVARRARETAMAVLSGGTEVEVVAIDRAGKVVGHAG